MAADDDDGDGATGSEVNDDGNGAKGYVCAPGK
jgi:hypothetical protein